MIKGRGGSVIIERSIKRITIEVFKGWRMPEFAGRYSLEGEKKIGQRIIYGYRFRNSVMER